MNEASNKGINPLLSLKNNPITSLTLVRDYLAISSKIGVTQLWKVATEGILEYSNTLRYEGNCFFETIFKNNSYGSTLVMIQIC